MKLSELYGVIIIALFFISIVFAHHIIGNEIYELKGIIIDQDNHDTLKHVHVILNNQPKALSDTNGVFSLRVRKGDTLFFSHLGYYSGRFVITDSIMNLIAPVVFYLNIEGFPIREVTVFPFRDYASFKSAVLNKSSSTEKINSEQNISYLKAQILDGVIPTYDAEMNFSLEMRNQQNKMLEGQIKLFSSNGQGGIGAFIRTIKRKRNK